MKITPQTIWDDLQKIRQTAPLVHNITNYVVMNNTANALLALGASPIMAHAPEEVEDLVKIAGALVINIGTLSTAWIESMQKAMSKARHLNTPMVFDPVGVGATAYRTATTQNLFAIAQPTVIRGNASEVLAICGQEIVTKGVDSTQESQAAVEVAKQVVQRYQCTVVISGASDFIVDFEQGVRLDNGHPLMAKVTGMGCTATAIIGAFLAVNRDSLMAATHAMAVMGIAGEMAAEKSAGPGSLQMHLLDTLYSLNQSDIESRLQLSQR